MWGEKEHWCCYCVCSSGMEKLGCVMMYRSVMSRSKQNLLSSISVVLRTQDLSVTDSVSPWKSWKVVIIYYIYINGSPAKVKNSQVFDVFCGHSQASHQICGRRSPCAESSALWQMYSNVWPNLTRREVALQEPSRWHTQSRNQLQEKDDKLLTFFLHI